MIATDQVKRTPIPREELNGLESTKGSAGGATMRTNVIARIVQFRTAHENDGEIL